MDLRPQEIIQFVLGLSMFVLVLSLWVGGVLVWAARRNTLHGRVRRRLGLDQHAVDHQRVLHLWHEGKEVTTTVHEAIRSGRLRDYLEQQFAAAGWPMEFAQIIIFLGGIVVMTITCMIVLTGSVLVALGVAAALIVVFRICLLGRIAKREAMFEAQLVDSLELAARSLRAGHPLLGAFQLLAEEMPPPIGTLFADICQQHGMGADLEQVLRMAGEMSNSKDMKLFASSVAAQMRSGGNLADLMERLALVIRDRMRLHRRVRVLTAQTQMSKRVLLVMPFVVFILLNVVNPDYMSAFYETFPGRVMLAISITLLTMGAWIMNRLVALKY